MKLIEGGLGMLDLELFDKSLKLTWIKRYFNSETMWKSIIQKKYPKIDNICNVGDTFITTFLTNIDNPFWENVLRYYRDFYNIIEPLTFHDLKMTSFI